MRPAIFMKKLTMFENSVAQGNFMGVAYYIALEQEIVGLDHLNMDGKILAKNAELLEGTAASLGVPTLETFISVPPEDIAELLGMEPIELENLVNAPDEARAMMEQLNAEMNQALQEFQSELEIVKSDGDGEIPPEQWFSAKVGLVSIQSLLNHVRNNLDEYHRPVDLVADLDRLREILNIAEEKNVRFHLSIDF